MTAPVGLRVGWEFLTRLLAETRPVCALSRLFIILLRLERVDREELEHISHFLDSRRLIRDSKCCPHGDHGWALHEACAAPSLELTGAGWDGPHSERRRAHIQHSMSRHGIEAEMKQLRVQQFYAFDRFHRAHPALFRFWLVVRRYHYKTLSQIMDYSVLFRRSAQNALKMHKVSSLKIDSLWTCNFQPTTTNIHYVSIFCPVVPPDLVPCFAYAQYLSLMATTS